MLHPIRERRLQYVGGGGGLYFCYIPLLMVALSFLVALLSLIMRSQINKRIGCAFGRVLATNEAFGRYAFGRYVLNGVVHFSAQ